MAAETKEQIKLESVQKKAAKKLAKKKQTRKKSLTSVYNKVSRAMQDYYRRIPTQCYGCRTNFAQVMHHHSHWGQSVALRFYKPNLVPLCSSCHFAFHLGNFKIKLNYEARMRSAYGQGWEDHLLVTERTCPHKTDSEKRQELSAWLKYYSLDFKNQSE